MEKDVTEGEKNPCFETLKMGLSVDEAHGLERITTQRCSKQYWNLYIQKKVIRMVVVLMSLLHLSFNKLSMGRPHIRGPHVVTSEVVNTK